MSAGCAHSRAAPARLELAHILRALGPAYAATHRLAVVQQRAVADVCACRTEAMGVRHFRCDACGAETLLYCSCGNRHCPKCQSLARERWLSARRAELLPVPYFHVVFTLPHELNGLAQANPRVIYGLLFDAASRTLLEFGANPRWLGGELAITLILHTWGQNLSQHLHVHALVSGGALSTDRSEFLPPRRGFLFPVRALSKVFRGKYLARLEAALAHGHLRLAGPIAELAQPPPLRRWLQALRAQDWVVYVKPPFAGPESVLQYLGRYTHRVALSNDRLVAFDGEHVRFRWRDYAHGNRLKILTLEAPEFIRRFLLHVLPKGLMRIRHYGLTANRSKAGKLAAARAALKLLPPIAPSPPETLVAFWQRITGSDLSCCPQCHQGTLRLVAVIGRARCARGPPVCS